MARHQKPKLMLATVRRRRASLLLGTALSAASFAVFVTHAPAQPAPNAQPGGGRVVAGSASIAQSPSTTTITQSTQRAAINWQNFDVGSNQTVQFQQPSASSMTLNRVVGPDPSQIAGRITANGGIVITNQSGVTFYHGAEVNASSLVVSAPGIRTHDFMAGKLNFSRPAKPNAAVTNDGTLTVQQTGLAALVAPRVANSGVINARMGHAVLAGGEAATIDLYGDGLLSIDVTKQVVHAPIGPDGKPVTALVTNTGTIIADGGTIQLTARAADGIVQNLVDAGGHIRAGRVGGQTGQIAIQGVGGNVVVSGQVVAPGGQIAVNTTNTVSVAGGARVSAAGGTVALGTTIARAQAARTAIATKVPAGIPAGTARRVEVASGAVVSADGRGSASGGTVAILSTGRTHIAGAVSSRGGPKGGDGGVVEESSAGQLALEPTAIPDESAPHGKHGTVLFDPYDLYIENNPGDGTPAATFNAYGSPNTSAGDSPTSTSPGGSYITPSQIQAAAANGDVVIQTQHNLTVAQAIDLSGTTISTSGGSASLTLQAVQGDLTVSANITMGTPSSTGGGLANLSLTAGGNLFVNNGAVITGTNAVTLTANGTLNIGTDSTAPYITAGSGATLSMSGGSVYMLGGTLAGPYIAVSATDSTGGGIVTLAGGSIGTAGTGRTTVSGFSGVSITGGTIQGGTVDLEAPGNLVTESNGRGTIVAGDLIGSAGAYTLDSTSNRISGIATNYGESLSASNADIGVTSSVALQVGGANASVTGGAVAVESGGTIRLTADQISVGPGYAFYGSGHITNYTLETNTGGASNGGGTVILQPLSTNNSVAVELSTTPTGNAGISINPAYVDANTLKLGSNTAGIVTVAADGTAISLLGTPSVQGIGELDLLSGVSIGQSGSLAVTTLTANAPSVSLNSGGNAVANLGASSASNGQFVLYSTGPMSVTGAVTSSGTTNGVFLTADSFAFGASGSLSTSGRVELLSATSATLTLPGFLPSNPPITAAILQVGDNLGPPIQINAPFVAGAGIGFLGLGSNYTITETGTGAITAAGLTGDATTVTLNGPNSIGFTAWYITGSLSLTNSGNLQVDTIIASGSATINETSGALTLTSNVSVPGGTVSLSGGVISQTGGAITTSTLTGLSTSTVTLDGANQVDNFGPFYAATSLSFYDNQSLTVAGGYHGGNAVQSNGAITLNVQGTLTIDATMVGVFAPGNATTLTATGDITQTAGPNLYIVTDTLKATSTNGSVLLTNTGNSIHNITQGSAGVLFSVVSNSALTASNVSAPFIALSGAGLQVKGPLTGTNQITLTSTGANNGIALVGATVSVGGSLSFTTGAGGNVTEDNASTFSAQNLLGSVGGTTQLTAATNHFTYLDAFSGTGNISIADASPLNVNAQVSSSGGISLASDTITFSSNGRLSSPGQTVSLAPLTSGAGFALSSVPIADISAGTLSIGSATTGNITISGNNNFSNVGTLVLTSGLGNIIENSGASLTVATLRGSAATGSASLSGANSIATLGAFTTATGFTLNDISALIVSGPVQDNNSVAITSYGGITVNGGISAQTVSLVTGNGNSMAGASPLVFAAGTVSAPSTLTLTVNGAVSQTGGIISTGLLTGSSTGQTTLNNAANAVQVIGQYSSTGGFSLVTSGDLEQGLSLTDLTSISLNAAGNLRLTGTLAAPNVNLVAAQAREFPGAAIDATTLTGNVSTFAQLNNSTNAVSYLGAFTAGTGFTLTDGTNVTVTGAVSVGGGYQIAIDSNQIAFGEGGRLSALGGRITLDPATTGSFSFGAGLPSGAITTNVLQIGSANATSVNITGAINLGNNVSEIDLMAAGAVTQAIEAAISVPKLVITAGSATLTQNNAVSTLSFTTSSGLNFEDTSPVTVSGSDGVSIALNSGSLTLGDLSAPTIGLSGGTVVESAGATIRATTLTTLGTQNGAVDSATLNSANNAITDLGFFSAGAGFSLQNGRALTVSGEVYSAGNVSLNVPGNLTINDLVQGQVVTLTSAGSITEGANGAIVTDTLTGSAVSAVLNGSGNTFASNTQIATLGAFSVSGGNLQLTDGAPLTVTGPLSATGTISLLSAGPLTVSGDITAPTIGLTANAGNHLFPSLPQSGDLVQTAGTIHATQSLGLIAAGVVSQSGGTMVVDGFLNGSSGGSTTLTSAGNAIGTVINYQSGGAFLLQDSTSLNVNASLVALSQIGLSVTGGIALAAQVTAPTINLVASGPVTESAGSIQTTTLTGTVGSAALASSANAFTNLGAFTSSGNVSVTDGQTLNVTGPVSVPNGGTLALVSNSIQIQAGAASQPGGSLSAPGGTVSLAPLTPNTAFNLGSFVPAGAITAATLNIGSLTTGTITIAGTFNLTNVNTLSLTSGAGVTENGTGSLIVNTLTGNANSATLDGSNQIATLGGFTTAGSFLLTDLSTLNVSGPVSGNQVSITSTGQLSLLGNITAPTITLRANNAASVAGGTTLGNIVQSTGIVDATGTLTLTAAGAIAQTQAQGEQPAGTIIAGTLTGSSVNDTSLTSGTNAITTLAAFSSAGGFALNNSAPSTQTGLLKDTTRIALTGTGSLTLAGTLQAPTVSLGVTGGISQTGGSSIQATTLTGAGGTGAIGSATLSSSANAFTDLGGLISTGNLAITDSQTLNVTGPVSVPNGGTLALVSNSIQIQAGAASQPGGSLSAPGGTVSLAPLTPNTAFNLGSFVPAGAITANTLNIGSATTGTISIAGTFNLANVNTLSLTSGAGVTENGTGRLIVSTLAGSAATATLDGPNQVGTLAAFSTTGAFTLVDAAPLNVTGPVSGGQVSITSTGQLSLLGNITAPTITLTANNEASVAGGTTLGNIVQSAGTVDASSTLTLAAAAAIAQTQAQGQLPAGIIAGTLTGSSGGSTSLTSATNRVGTLAAFSSAGGFALNNSAPSTQTGLLKDTTRIALTGTGSLTLAGTLQAPTVSLGVTGGISQTGGSSIQATTLTGAGGTGAIGSATLSSSANAFTDLGGLISTGNLAITDSQTLNVTGPVSVPNGGTLALVSNSIQIQAGAASQPGGSLSAPGGTVSLAPLTPNTAFNLGSFVPAGAITANTLNIGSATTGTISIAGTFNLANVNTLSLTSGAGVTENGTGRLIVSTLAGSAATATLDGPNQVGTLAAFSTTGAFTLVDAAPLNVTGPVSGGQVSITSTGQLSLLGNITAPTITLTANNEASVAGGTTLGNIVQSAGTVDASSTLTLAAAAAIAQTQAQGQLPAGIIAGTLTGSSGGSTSLTSGTNAITTLAAFSSAGGFALNNSAPSTQTGLLKDTTRIALTGTGSLTLAGTLQAPTVSLGVTGGISQTGGSSIQATTLTGTGSTGAVGSASLTSTTNAVTDIGGIVASGDFTLADAGPLNVTGAVSVGTGHRLSLFSNSLQIQAGAGSQPGGSLSAPGGTISLAPLTAGTAFALGSFVPAGSIVASTLNVGSATTGNISIAGTFDLTNVGTLSLTSGAGIAENGTGRLIVSTLTGSAATATLDAGNQIGTLAGFTTTGGFTLVDAQTLNVTGPVQDAAFVSLRSTGQLSLLGNITAPTITLTAVNAPSVAGGTTLGNIIQSAGTVNASGTLTLSAAAAIAQTAPAGQQPLGTLVAGTLTGSSVADTSLSSASNAITALGAFSSTGGFTLNNSVTFTQTGLLQDTTRIALAGAGPLTLAGALKAPIVSLGGSGGISQTGGSSIQATTLTGATGTGAVGSAALTSGANAITNIGGIVGSGNLTIADGSPLNVTGLVSVGSGGTLSLLSNSVQIQTGGSLSAPNGTVSLAPLTANTAFSLGSFVPSGGITAKTLSVGNAGTGDIGIAGSFNLPGVNTLSLTSAGTVSEGQTGSLGVATLTGSAATATLDGPNKLGSLGAFTTATSFTLNNAQSLTVTGPVQGGTATTISTTADLTLNSTVSGGTVSLTATGITEGTNGGLVATTLSGSASSVQLGTGVQVATLAGWNAGAGSFGLVDGTALTVAGPVIAGQSVSLGSTGSIAVNAPIGGPGNTAAQTIALNAGGPLTLNNVVTGATVSLQSSGAINQTGGAVVATTLTGNGQSLALNQPGNRIGNFGSFTASGQDTASTVALTDSQALSVTGQVNATGAITLNDTAPIALAGTITAPSLELDSSGTVQQTAGSLTVGTLSGRAVQLAQFGVPGTGTAAVSTLGSMILTGSTLTLVDTVPLTVVGPLHSSNINLTAPNLLTLQGGQITTNAATLTVNGAGAQLVQTGFTNVTPNGGPSTLTVNLPGSGIASFNTLNAPSSDVVLNLGSGSASGTINAANLQVNGSGGSAALFGTVAGQTGFSAATIAGISPATNSAYQLNGCVIATACSPVITPIFVIQDDFLVADITPKSFLDSTLGGVLRPNLFTLDLITIGIARDPTETDLVLPNISDRDY